MRTTMAVLAVAAATMVGAAAQDEKKPKAREKAKRPAVDWEAKFKLADADKDGRLTKPEFKKLLEESGSPQAAKMAERHERLFRSFDTNTDSFLSVEEVKDGNKRLADRRAKAKDKDKPAEPKAGNRPDAGEKPKPEAKPAAPPPKSGE